MIGKRIRDLRTHKGITQEAVSKALGVSAQAVSKWEQGITSPDISLLVPIADYFGVSLDALLRENYDAYMANPEDLVKIRVEKHGRYPSPMRSGNRSPQISPAWQFRCRMGPI